MGVGLVQLGGQAEPQLVKNWPSTGQSAMQVVNWLVSVNDIGLYGDLFSTKGCSHELQVHGQVEQIMHIHAL